MPGPVQLLQLLLIQQAFGSVAEAGASEDVDEAAAGLQQYIADLLQHLQEAATVHEVGVWLSRKQQHAPASGIATHGVCLPHTTHADAAWQQQGVPAAWLRCMLQCRLQAALFAHGSSSPSGIQRQFCFRHSSITAQ
jgi:hypothetical protein